MILINTTFHVHNSIIDEFIDWANNIYINKALSSEYLSSPLLSKILADTDPEGTSFALQLKATDIDKAQQWHDIEAQTIKNDAFRKWGEKMLHFTTYMEIIEK